jgi:hypothetical protein
MQMDVQERGTCHLHTSPQRRLDVIYVVEPFRPNQIDDEMGASIADPIALTEKVLALVPRSESEAPGIRFFRLGGA